MATVTVYTAARMQEIEDASIASVAVVAGNLILTREDATTVDAGSVSNVVTNPIFFGSAGLTTSLATLAGSWWGYKVADYSFLGGTLEWRACAVVNGIVVADSIGIALYNTVTSSLIVSEALTVSTIANGQKISTPWAAVPVANAGGYAQVRNQTAARGTLANAWLEIRRTT